jgi:hypothetical protein
LFVYFFYLIIAETLVRQLCVDLLGKILVAVHRDSHSLNELADHLDEISKSTGVLLKCMPFEHKIWDILTWLLNNFALQAMRMPMKLRRK